MSLYTHPHDRRLIIRGLVPVTFQLDLATRRSNPFQPTGDRYDDYVWLEYFHSDGLAPEAVQQAIADLLTSILQDMHNLEVPQEMALKSLGFRVRIVRSLQESPHEVDLMTTFDTATNKSMSTGAATHLQQQQQQHHQQQIQVQNNARLADWVQWGILQKDPAKFRFVVYPITPANNPSSQGQ